MLLDSFGRTIDYLRISVNDRCDMRCVYCLPKDFNTYQQREHYLSLEELYRIIIIFSELGVQHFRFTGGEPLLRQNLTSLIEQVAKLPKVKDISLTTNGTNLARLAPKLKQAGLKRINVSLDSLDHTNFKKITGLNVLDKVLEGLAIAKSCQFSQIKINMVPISNTSKSDISAMIEFCIQNNFILRLIEVMPLGDTGYKFTGYNLQNILNYLTPKFALEETKDIYGSGPARYWQSRDGKFTLGLITPMSQHFCFTCNRVRLSVDGTLYLCLGQEFSISLRQQLRNGCSDAELKAIIIKAINLKPQQHDFNTQPRKIVRFMATTGG